MEHDATEGQGLAAGRIKKVPLNVPVDEEKLSLSCLSGVTTLLPVPIVIELVMHEARPPPEKVRVAVGRFRMGSVRR